MAFKVIFSVVITLLIVYYLLTFNSPISGIVDDAREKIGGHIPEVPEVIGVGESDANILFSIDLNYQRNISVYFKNSTVELSGNIDVTSPSGTFIADSVRLEGFRGNMDFENIVIMQGQYKKIFFGGTQFNSVDKTINLKAKDPVIDIRAIFPDLDLNNAKGDVVLDNLTIAVYDETVMLGSPDATFHLEGTRISGSGLATRVKIGDIVRE